MNDFDYSLYSWLVEEDPISGNIWNPAFHPSRFDESNPDNVRMLLRIYSESKGPEDWTSESDKQVLGAWHGEFRPTGWDLPIEQLLEIQQKLLNGHQADSNNSWYKMAVQYHPMERATDYGGVLKDKEKGKEKSDVFYSKLVRELDKKLPPKSNVNQIKQIILSPKFPVQQEEVEWSGILEWLDGYPYPNNVIKEDMMSYLNNSPLQIKETYPKKEEATLEEPLDWSDFDTPYPDEEELQYQKENVKDLYEDEIKNETLEELLDEWGYDSYEEIDEEDKQQFDIKWENKIDEEIEKRAGEQYYEGASSVATESNYGYKAYYDNLDQTFYLVDDENNEIELRDNENWDSVQADAEEHALENYGERETEFQYEDYKLDGGKHYRELLFAWEPPDDYEGKSYESNHFNEENIVAHTRYTDRELDNQSMLFIEEMQSDWHQEGRDKGYTAKKLPEGSKILPQYQIYENLQTGDSRRIGLPFPSEKNDIESLIGAAEERARPSSPESPINGYKDLRIPIESGRLSIRQYQPFSDTYGYVLFSEGEEYDFYSVPSDEETNKNALKVYNEGKTPAGPFSDTKAWTGLIARRMLRQAAEEDKDLIGWTTGDIQKDRYDFSNFADMINVTQYTKEEGQPLKLTVWRGQNVVHNETVNSMEELDQYIGYELRNRIQQQKPIEDNGTLSYTIEGDDLQLPDDSGMNQYYDKLVPSVLGKIGKKYKTKPRVEKYYPEGKHFFEVKQNSLGEYYAYRETNKHGTEIGFKNDKGKVNKRYTSVFHSEGGLQGAFYNTPEEAQEIADKLNEKESVQIWVMDVPDQMKEDILYQGQPLFASNKNWYKIADASTYEEEEEQLDDFEKSKRLFEDLVTMHELEYALSRIKWFSKKNRLPDRANMFYLKNNDRLIRLSNDIIAQMLEAFNGWIKRHDDPEGWAEDAIGALQAGRGKIQEKPFRHPETGIVIDKNIDITYEVKDELEKELIINYNDLPPEWQAAVEEVYFYENIANIANSGDPDAENLVESFFEENPEYKEEYEEEHAPEGMSVGEFIQNYYAGEFFDIAAMQGELNPLGVDLSTGEYQIDLDEYAERVGWDWWDIFISDADYIHTYPDGEKEFEGGEEKQFFYIFERVAREGSGMDQWKASYPGIENNEESVRASIERMENALDSDNVDDKTRAISLGLNTAHYFGNMSEHLGLSKSEMDQLSNLDVSHIDRQLNNMGIRIAEKSESWYKFAIKEGLDEDIEVPEEYFETMQNLNEVAESLGLKVYAVGGFVRDLLVGRTPKDLDVMVDVQDGAKYAEHIRPIVDSALRDKKAFIQSQITGAKEILDVKEDDFELIQSEHRPEFFRIKATIDYLDKSGKQPKKVNNEEFETSINPSFLFASNFGKQIPRGEAFGIFAVMTPVGEVEIAYPRTETYEEGSRKPRTEMGTLQEDANRRDFGMNALFMDLKDFEITDLTGHGLQDIKDKIIRITDPSAMDIIFRDDPLRILRAIRQAAQLGFQIDPAILEYVKNNPHIMAMKGDPITWDDEDFEAKLSSERIAEETRKIMSLPKAYESFKLMEDLGIEHHVFKLPEEAENWRFDQRNKHHYENVFDHTVSVMREADKSMDEYNVSPQDRFEINMAALLHDTGKLIPERGYQNRYDDAGEFDRRTFVGHPDVSTEIANSILRRLKYSNAETDRISKLVQFHDHALALEDPKNRDYNLMKIIKEIGPLVTNLMHLAIGDKKAHIEGYNNSSHLEGILRELPEKYQGYEARTKTFINGRKIQQMLHAKAGKWIGDLMNFIIDGQMRGVINNEADAEEFVSRIATASDILNKPVGPWISLILDNLLKLPNGNPETIINWLSRCKAIDPQDNRPIVEKYINGNDVMEKAKFYGVTIEGRDIGLILEEAMNAQFNKVFTNREEGLQWLDGIISEMVEPEIPEEGFDNDQLV